MDLINGEELPQAYKTPSRRLVILLSSVVALLFAVTVLLLKEFSNYPKRK